MCHNNGIGDSIVGTGNIEVLKVPSTCMTETEIDAICRSESETSMHENEARLKQEAANCLDVISRYDGATVALKEIRQELSKLTTAVMEKESRGSAVQAEITALHDFIESVEARPSVERMEQPEEELTRFVDSKDSLTALVKEENQLHHALSSLHAELEKARIDLKEDEAKKLMIQMIDEWEPMQDECKAKMHVVRNVRDYTLGSCARKFYNHSCERACIEQSQGCGVIEATRPGEGGLDGMELACKPPQPSWIMRPYPGVEGDSADSQCERIKAHQSVKYALRILKSGYLEKKGRNGNWELRYFVLESGDAVRSAVLRYWDSNPANDDLFAESKAAKESESKLIILQDAVSVKTLGYNCFVLSHFYRDYKLCEPKQIKDRNKQILEWEKEKVTSVEERNRWVALIRSNIGK
jgi:hypothetical protein